MSAPYKCHRPERVFDRKLFQAYRKRRGWNIDIAGAVTDINKWTISRYEKGENLPPLHRFQALADAYELDPFEVCEVLKLFPVPKDLLRQFRAACRREGKTPLQVVMEFMKVYAGLV